MHIAPIVLLLVAPFCAGLAAPPLLRRFHRSMRWLLVATGGLWLAFALEIATASSSALHSETSPHDFWILFAVAVNVAWIAGLACGGLATGWWAMLRGGDA
jgi:hypothetical protein